MKLAHFMCVCLTCRLVNGDTETLVKKPLKFKESSCSVGDDCDVTSETDNLQIDEKTKYFLEQAKQYQLLHQDDENSNLSDEQITEKIANLRNTIHKQNQRSDNNQDETKDILEVKDKDTAKNNQPPSLYEFPPLTRVDPVKVSQ